MGRRASIVNSIVKISKSIQTYERRQERQNLINNYSGGPKEQAPTFSLQYVDFNPETRATKIQILQTQQYRTIERYVTQNYVKYPIYSNWKTRTKNISKSIKLTNEELENLNHNSDNFIRAFASEIVERLDNEELMPSWYLLEIIEADAKEKVDAVRESKKGAENSFNELSSNISKIASSISSKVISTKSRLKADKEKLAKINKKIDFIKSSSKSSVLKIVTIGIYGALTSDKRLRKLEKQAAALNELIAEQEKFITDSALIQEVISGQKNYRNSALFVISRNYQYKVDKERKDAEKMKKEITPLTVAEDE